MAISVGFQHQRPSVLEPIVDQMVERSLFQSELKIQDLFDRLVELTREPQVLANEKVEAFLKKTIKQIDYRSPLEFLGREEQRFYNYSSALIDRKKDKIDPFYFETLQNIVFTDPPECDEGFNIYRIAFIRKQIFDKELQGMREEIDTLTQKLKKYMTMTPIQIHLPITGDGTYPIPQEIPADATHILVHMNTHTGGAGHSQRYDLTLSNSLGQRYPVYYWCYHQNAVSYNSENIWIEICPRREITINGFRTIQNCRFEVHLLGYK